MRKPLANKELAIMNLLWDKQPLTAKQMRQRLYPDATRSRHGTVQKLLQRLEEKAFIQCDRSEKTYSYTYVLSRETYTAEQVVHLTDPGTFSRLIPDLLTYLVQQEQLSKEEISSIRETLDQLDDEPEAE